MSTELAVKKPNGSEPEESGLVLVQPQAQVVALSLSGAPTEVLEEARRAAVALTSVIESKPTKVKFNNKTYLQFEDWQTLGRFYGVTSICRSTKYVEFGEGDKKVCGFEAVADSLLVQGNQVISSAEALCLNDERNWKGKPLFQLKSMAQTRACAKSLRNVLAWVVVLAGYAPTPAEEMEGNAVVHTDSAQPATFRLDDERYVELRDGIENANNLQELDQLYKAALAEAKDDQESKQDFGKAKNKAWRRLNAGR